MGITKAVGWALLAAIVAGAVYGAILLRQGLSTQDPPSAIEIAIARGARNASIPSSAKNLKNPYSATSENMEPGLEHFADHCAICHDNDGSGNSDIGPNLYPKAPDLRLAQTQSLTDGELFYIINNGVRLTGMPGWGKSHTAEDTWELVLFIRHLPQLRPDEKRRMLEFNPKSYDEDGH